MKNDGNFASNSKGQGLYKDKQSAENERYKIAGVEATGKDKDEHDVEQIKKRMEETKGVWRKESEQRR